MSPSWFDSRTEIVQDFFACYSCIDLCLVNKSRADTSTCFSGCSLQKKKGRLCSFLYLCVLFYLGMEETASGTQVLESGESFFGPLLSEIVGQWGNRSLGDLEKIYIYIYQGYFGGTLVLQGYQTSRLKRIVRYSKSLLLDQMQFSLTPKRINCTHLESLDNKKMSMFVSENSHFPLKIRKITFISKLKDMQMDKLFTKNIKWFLTNSNVSFKLL